MKDKKKSKSKIMEPVVMPKVKFNVQNKGTAS